MIVISTRTAVLNTLYKIQISHKATYSSVTRFGIRKLLIKYYKINICLSTIDYHLGILKRFKYIRVHPRFGTKPDMTHFNLPSNRSILGKGLNVLMKLGVSISNMLSDWAFRGIKPPRRKRKSKPPKSYIVTQRPPRRSAANPEALGDVLKSSLGALT